MTTDPLSDERSKAVADLRFLAAARKEYCRRCPESQNEMQQMSPTEMAIHMNHETAEWLADILAGANTGHGWLPSWRWDEWPATREETA